MAEWYEVKYKLADKPIDMPGFPRPMYPPDAAGEGKQPSMNGPDVMAYKRIAWQLCRWEGPASNFDYAYSNNFAHGKGPNVINTGIEGIQRQQGISATGWIGKQTWDFFLRALVPKNTPGVEGAYAMDAYSQSLLVQAWDQFGGSEPAPDPPPPDSLRTKALNKAISQLGVKESPPNSNQTKYTQWYGMVGPWCAMFCTWAFETSGDSPAFVQGQRWAYVPYIVSDARNNRNGLSVTNSPIAGDLVCYDWYGDGTYDHVGIFEKWTTGRQFTAIEGNTSTSSDSDGGEVMRRTRDAATTSIVFARVKEP